MTLITYFSRVHFADGVLEDALYSELELHQYHRPFTICEAELDHSEFAERLNSGIPARSNPEHFGIKKGIPQQDLIQEICDQFNQSDGDVLVAFGSSKAILLAGKCRALLHEQAAKKTGKDRSLQQVTDLFAIPGVDGLPNMTRSAIASTKLSSPYFKKYTQPSVIICDPTLTLGAPPNLTASAAVNTLSRCIEAYLSVAYYPPADGIALDGLSRTVCNLHDTLRQDNLMKRRELMAASLNGTLAQQKGTGMVQALADTLTYASQTELDEGALKGILLPGVLNLTDELTTNSQKDQIRTVLKIPQQHSLPEGLLEFISSLPLPSTLHEIGVTRSSVSYAARELTVDEEFPMHDEATLLSMMSAVYALE